MFIFSSLFVVWDSTGVAWKDSQFKKKKSLIYLILTLYGGPQFILSLKAYFTLIGQTSRSPPSGSFFYFKGTGVYRNMPPRRRSQTTGERWMEAFEFGL